MANRVIIKRSNQTGQIPDYVTLAYGELALNYTDGGLYYRDNNDEIKDLASKGSWSLTISDTQTVTDGSSITITGAGATEVVNIDNNITISSTDTTYETFTSTTSGLVPTPNEVGNTKYLNQDGTWSLPTDNNFTDEYKNKIDLIQETTKSISTSGTTPVAIMLFDVTQYRGAKIVIQAWENTTSSSYITELLLTHDGTNIMSTEYGSIATSLPLASFDIDINTNNARLIITSISTNTTDYKVNITTL